MPTEEDTGQEYYQIAPGSIQASIGSVSVSLKASTIKDQFDNIERMVAIYYWLREKYPELFEPPKLPDR